MMTAKLFENGRSQAVRLPKEYRFNGDEVAINKVGDIVILMPKENKWSAFLNSLELFSFRILHCCCSIPIYINSICNFPP